MKNAIGMAIWGICALIMARAMDWITEPESRNAIMEILRKWGKSVS